MSKAGRERQRERAEKRQAMLRRKERRRKLRNYAIIGLVLAMLGGLFAAAAIADATTDNVSAPTTPVAVGSWGPANG